jgi:hypothetical protein
LRFAKWHGLGNDYLLVEQDDLGAPLEADLVRRLCDYHFGVGSDGVLEVLAADGPRAEIVIWNPDGSTAELSGNGTRIAARWLARRAGTGEVTIAVGEREVHARMRGGLEVEMDMGAVEVAPTSTGRSSSSRRYPWEIHMPSSPAIPREKSFCGSARSSRTTRAFPTGRTCSSSVSTRARTRPRASGSAERGRPFPRVRAPAPSPAPLW